MLQQNRKIQIDASPSTLVSLRKLIFPAPNDGLLLTPKALKRMRRTLLKSKIHRATVTDANLHYEGSVTIDQGLLELTDIHEYEQVHIYNVNNGNRLITYAIVGERGGGNICINGAAAHLVNPGDLVIICAYGQYEAEEGRVHQPRVVLVDEKNRPIGTAR